MLMKITLKFGSAFILADKLKLRAPLDLQMRIQMLLSTVSAKEPTFASVPNVYYHSLY